MKKDVMDKEAHDDNDGCEVPDDVDIEYGLDDEGVDKRQAVMLALPMWEECIVHCSLLWSLATRLFYKVLIPSLKKWEDDCFGCRNFYVNK